MPGDSISAYARHRNVSRTAVQKALKSGRIKSLADGTIDRTAADAAWAAHAAAYPQPPGMAPGPRATAAPLPAGEGEGEAPGGGEPPADTQQQQAARGYQTSRAVRESYMARLAKLEFEERQGSLVSAADVKVAAFNVARRARDLMLAIPDRVATVLAASDDPHEIRRVLSGELRRVCEELSSGNRASGVDLR